MSSPARQSRQRKRPRSQAKACPPGAEVLRDPGELPAIPVVEDETYHLMAGPDLEMRLMKLHESISNLAPQGFAGMPQAVEVPGEGREIVTMSPAAALPGELSVCSACTEEIKALGLPYRIILRCTHE